MAPYIGSLETESVNLILKDASVQVVSFGSALFSSICSNQTQFTHLSPAQVKLIISVNWSKPFALAVILISSWMKRLS